jgi:hypothetical protein
MSLQALSDYTVYSRYAHYIPEKKRRETWSEIIDRVFGMHETKFQKELESNTEFRSEFEHVKQLVKDKKVLGSQRALQFGGDGILKKNAKIYNCLSQDTEFITSNGVKSFHDYLDGDKIVVQTGDGSWQNAKVKSYGKQNLNKIELALCHSGEISEIFATENHRWILDNGEETTKLKEGDRVIGASNSFIEFDYYNATPFERLYWCYGYVFGDGTNVKNNDGEYQYSMVRLCGKDKKYNDRFAEMGFKISTPLSCGGDSIAYTGTYLKTAPNPNIDNPELIRAFVHGYLAADGEKNRNKNTHEKPYVSIQSSDEDHINFIRECFPIAGVYITYERDFSNEVTNFSTRGHAIRFAITCGPKHFTVKSIERNVKTEIVWCLEVENTRNFILKNGAVTGNCTSSIIDRPRVFQEIGYLLLCGCGAGYSVQHHHTTKLPNIKHRTKGVKVYKPEDSIEGWAECWGILINSFFENGIYPEYEGYEIEFDLSGIRPEGELIAGQFKAPGPIPLEKSLIKIQGLIDNSIESGSFKLTPLQAHDIICHIADSVISGGVRRSALIVLFSKEDKEMAECKTGNWFFDNPQRGRANNSVVLERGKITKQEFDEIFKNIKSFGEPGFYFVDDGMIHQTTNPCCLVGDSMIHTDGGLIRMDILIEKLNQGIPYKALSYDYGHNRLVFNTILNGIKTKKDSKTLYIEVVGGDDVSSHIECTSDHKFYNCGEYVEACNLKIGDVLCDSSLKDIIITNIRDSVYNHDVYDIEVENAHNFFANNMLVHNCEIGFWPILENGDSGFGGCNLTEINGSMCKTYEEFIEVCKAASFIGTLQAAYTDFPYLGKTTEEIFKREALLGVSITGWMDNPVLLFDETILKDGVNAVKDENIKIAKFLGINPAARTTCTKPSGSASCVLMTGSGIHGNHSGKYLRRAQVNKKEFAGKVMKKKNPISVTESVWSTNKTDNVISFPCTIPEGAIFKRDLTGVKFLEKIKFAFEHWVLPGGSDTPTGLNPSVTHNISCTVNISDDDEWGDVREYIFENRNQFSGISLLAGSGDLDYDQAPFVEVLNPTELVERYGDGVPLASGLIVDGLHCFDNLWTACASIFNSTDESNQEPIEPKKPIRKKYTNNNDYNDALSEYALGLTKFYNKMGKFEKFEWIRRAKQFASRYFDNDIQKMTYCLKHVSIWKDWLDINRDWVDIEWETIKEGSQEYVDADTLAAISCNGGQCEVKI